jgi:hypothetical protein
MGLCIDGNRIISDIKFTCSCSLLVDTYSNWSGQNQRPVQNGSAINIKALIFTVTTNNERK